MSLILPSTPPFPGQTVECQKANDLWKKQRASTNAVDIITKKMGRRLVTPGQTRWNSKFDALVCLTELMEGELTRQVIYEMIYVYVYPGSGIPDPGCGTGMYFGTLLPTIVAAKKKLDAMNAEV